MRNIHRINGNIYITNSEEIKEGNWWLYICPINGLDYGDDGNPIVKNNLPNSWFEKLHDKLNYKKIILTTDQDLIKDGVQAIDDTFLEWFVKNPSCEEVELEVDLSKHNGQFQTKYGYKIIIPKEEPKQLTDLEIAIKLEEIEREEVRAVNRTDLYNSILSIVKQIPRENVERDAMDAPSCAYEIEQLFYKWQEPKIETLEEAAERLAIHCNNDFIKGAKWQQERMYSEEEVETIAKDAYIMGRNNILIGVFNKWFEQFKKK